jgi:hypothetical protein
MPRATTTPSTCHGPLQRTRAVPESTPSSAAPPHEGMVMPWRLARPFMAKLERVSARTKGTVIEAAVTSNSMSPFAAGVRRPLRLSGPLRITLRSRPSEPIAASASSAGSGRAPSSFTFFARMRLTSKPSIRRRAPSVSASARCGSETPSSSMRRNPFFWSISAPTRG